MWAESRNAQALFPKLTTSHLEQWAEEVPEVPLVKLLWKEMSGVRKTFPSPQPFHLSVVYPRRVAQDLFLPCGFGTPGNISSLASF